MTDQTTTGHLHEGSVLAEFRRRGERIVELEAEVERLRAEAPLANDLTHLDDDELAAANRLHDIIHPAGPSGLYEPDRNPSGCDRLWCLGHVPELIHGAERRIRMDERGRR